MSMPIRLHTIVVPLTVNVTYNSLQWVELYPWTSSEREQEAVYASRGCAMGTLEWGTVCDRADRTHQSTVQDQRVLLRLCLREWRKYATTP